MVDPNRKYSALKTHTSLEGIGKAALMTAITNIGAVGITSATGLPHVAGWIALTLALSNTKIAKLTPRYKD